MKPVDTWTCADAPALKARLEQQAAPVLLKGLVSHWPVLTAARQGAAALCDYLHRFDRGTEVIATKTRAAAQGVMGYNAALTDFDFVKARMGLAEFMDHLLGYQTVASPPAIAAQCAKVAEVIPGFLADNGLATLPEVVPNFWLGNALTVPVHHDHPYNIACVAAGRRRFTLFAPEQVGNLYIGPLEHTPSGAPISVVHPKAPDFERYPRYREALAAAQVAELEPGDAIYIPPLWYHQVEALEPINLLINYWWPVAGAAELPSPASTLLQAIQVLNALPPLQRQAWAAMFEHYVAQQDLDPGAHVPAPWRGALNRRP